jgi:uncharacterized protein (TIGR02271 family)
VVGEASDAEVPRNDIVRVDATDGDSGEIETLPDGSISIPVKEEELVVTKRVVVRERVIVRKDIEETTERIESDLRHEHVEVDAPRSPDELV